MPVTSTLIKGGHILTVDPSVPDLTSGDVLIEGDTIKAVGRDLQADNAEIVDASGMIVCPGFVDTHRHTWQTPLRTVASDYTLAEYGFNIRLGYSAFYRPEDVLLSNYAGAIEALNAGVTTIVDHSHIIASPEHADAALQGLVDAGGRAVFCYGFSPITKHHPLRFDERGTEWLINDARRIRSTRLAGDEGPIYFGLAPSDVERTPWDRVVSEIAFGREIGAKVISCHVAMSGHSIEVQPTITSRLGKANLLGPDLLLIHGNSLSREELSMVVDQGSGISVAPEVEVQMGMGRPILGVALRAGAKVGLGVDVVSNIGGDMFHPMRSALLEERGGRNDGFVSNGQIPRILELACHDMLRVATIGGAEAAGLAHAIGSLTPGKKADVICVSRSSLNMMAALLPEAALVHYATPSDVDSVWVNGRRLKRNGVLTGVDVKALVKRVWSSRERLEAEVSTVDFKSLRNFGGYQRSNFGN